MLCLPMAGMAQNQWERPDIQEKKAVKTEKEVTTEDPKYLEGAVPVVNGEVCWTLWPISSSRRTSWRAAAYRW